MGFWIYIQADSKRLRLWVELLLKNERVEQYRVSGRNRSIRVENNRPFFQAKGLKHRRCRWTVCEGQMHNQSALKKIIIAIEEHSKSTKH